MKKIIKSNRWPPRRAFFTLLFGIAWLWAMPRSARAQALQVGPTGWDVQFGLSPELDRGVQTSNALHPSGLVVEFHKSQNNSGIWYHIGRLGGTSVSWGASQKSGASGYWPTVAISQEGYVILVYSNNLARSGSELYYQVGTINPQGDQNQSINWVTGTIHWDGGFHTSIAMNNNGVILGVHESNSSNNHDLFYRIGHLGNPAGGNYAITWDSGGIGIRYDGGINPHIAINNLNQVVEVHQVSGEYLLHYRRGTLSGGRISFGDSQRYDNSAQRPAVTLLDNGLVLEMHCSGLREHPTLFLRAGSLNPSNSTFINFSASESLADGVDIEYPALANNGTYAVETHERAETLFYSTSAIRDRGDWMGDNLSWLGGYTLRDIVIPGSHDAGMYRGEVLGSPAVTQDQSLYYQLHGGVRYFDLRLLGGSPLYIYHGFSSVKGPPLQEVLTDVRNFMQEDSGRHREAVVLKFSHFKNFDCGDYSDLTTSLYNTLGLYLYQGALSGVHPARVPLNEILSTGGKVIVVVDGDWATDPATCRGQARNFTFVYRDSVFSPGDPIYGPSKGQFNVYDRYSNTDNYRNMVTDQINQYNAYDGRMDLDKAYECDLFLLSWTLTSGGILVGDFSAVANRNLGDEMTRIIRNPYGFIPNILYVDYYERARVTDTAISMTQGFLGYP
jgi:hypothetical protein